MNRRGDKVIEIEMYLKELRSILPNDLEMYLNSFEKRAACERYFEKIVEAVIDLIFIVIKEMDFKTPNSNREALDLLFENNVISENLLQKLKDAKATRNWLAHRYGKVNDELVFDSLKDELIRDVEEFLGAVK